MQGFLPTRGSLMLDAVALAMIVISIGMVVSIRLAKADRFSAHRTMQIVMSALLLTAIVAFEVDMRVFTDWRKLAEPSPLYGSGWVDVFLWIHLLFAIPTPFVWGFVLWNGLRRFPNPPQPGEHSPLHKRTGWLAVTMMLLTAITGWIFYFVSFILD